MAVTETAMEVSAVPVAGQAFNPGRVLLAHQAKVMRAGKVLITQPLLVE